VLLLQALQKLNVIDLTALLPESIDLTQPTGAILGVAILFGISERFLDKLVKQASDQIAPAPSAQRTLEPAAEPPSARTAAATARP
jgi:hypothetical protein